MRSVPTCKYSPYGNSKAKGKGKVTRSTDAEGKGKAAEDIDAKGTGNAAEEIDAEGKGNAAKEIDAEGKGNATEDIDAEGQSYREYFDAELMGNVTQMIDAEGKGKGKDTDAEGIDADEYGPQWFMREFGHEFSIITTMWHDVMARLMAMGYNKGKGKGVDMATEILMNKGKGKGKGDIYESARRAAWAAYFVQHGHDEPEEESVRVAGSAHVW